MTAAVALTSLTWSTLAIPFKASFKHASAERAETSSVWVEAGSASGLTGRGEACPRPYVTGETIDSARAFFDRHEASLRAEIVDLPALRRWMSAHAADIDANPAAFCAMELAILDLLARESRGPVEPLLSMPPLSGTFTYTAVLGDSDVRTFQATIQKYRQLGFIDFKIKLAGDRDRDREKIALLRDLGPACRCRADANNVWRDADSAIAALRDLDFVWFALEEPIGAGQCADLARLGEALETRIVLDESCLRVEQLAALPDPAARWIVNVRVSKMGGLLRSLAVVGAARDRGIGVIVGAQVGETSLLTRAGLTVARAAGTALVAQEGAFGTFLLAQDVCDPPLMFGAGGVLDAARHPRLTQPGWGI